MYCYQFLEELNKPNRNVKAVSILLTPVFQLLSGVDIQHLQDMANVQLLVRPCPHVWAWSYQLAAACAVRVVTTSSFEVLPLLSPAACDTWVGVLQLSPFKSGGIWSDAGHPGERGKSWTKHSSSVKPWGCQCRAWFSAIFSSKMYNSLSFLIGKNGGSCWDVLVSTGLNQRGKPVMVSTCF